MKRFRPALSLVVTVCIGCAAKPAAAPNNETPECLNYHSMMTAPMLPSAVMELKRKCEASLKKR